MQGYCPNAIASIKRLKIPGGMSVAVCTDLTDKEPHGAGGNGKSGVISEPEWCNG